MNIVILAESLGSGGAERQVCTLAGEFKRRGHEVCVATYAPGDFYLPLLDRDGIVHRFLGGHGKVSWAWKVRQFLQTNAQDVVLAFLGGPSAYAELAGFPKRTWGLVVSERSAGVAGWTRVKARLHLLADYMAVNSHAARLAMERRHPRLQPKLVTIYNAISVEPRATTPRTSDDPGELKLLVAARVDRNKNPKGLLAALRVLRATRPQMRFCVDWFGNQEADTVMVHQTREATVRLNLDGVFRLHPPADRIHDLMLQADAVLLPSHYEGLPNSVCEGMALGKPILMSDVCDAGNLVENGINGFLFDPRSQDSIADAIARFADLTSEERTRMGAAGRAKAEVLFDVNTVADRYLRVLEAAAAGQPLEIEHWPSRVPEAALCSPAGPRLV